MGMLVMVALIVFVILAVISAVGFLIDRDADRKDGPLT
jgi:hypothetical protein